MKAFIFQGRYDTVVVIAENSIIASGIVLEKYEDDDDYYLAGSVWCNIGAAVSVGPFIDTE